MREATIKFDQFKVLRAPVDAALGQLRDSAAQLRSFEVSASAPDQLRTDIAEVQAGIQKEFNALDTALRALDESRFAAGEEWAATVSEPWDSFIDSLDRAYSPSKGSSQIIDITRDAAEKLGQLIRIVQAKLDSEVADHMKLPPFFSLRKRVIRRH